MAKTSKRYREIIQKVDRDRLYPLMDALALVKETLQTGRRI